MLPLLLKTHIWESNIWNGLEWCLQKRQPAPTPCRLSAFVFLLQEQRTGVGMPAAGWGLGKAEAQGREWWVCNVCGCHWSEGPAGGTGSLQWAASLRLRRGNRGRVENNRTRQWHWDNLWSYLGIFNWPVSFSHLMHFHKDFSLPLVLSSRSSLDFPTDSLSGFLCFVSPPFPLQGSAELPGFVISKQKDRFSKGAVWESLVLFSREKFGKGGVTVSDLNICVCHLSKLFLHCSKALNINLHPNHM